MDILELLADADSGLTVSEISQRLKRRMSELFRIIVVLEQRQWLQKDPESSRYSVSYHVLKLAHRGTPAQKPDADSRARDARVVDADEPVMPPRGSFRHRRAW